MCPNVWWCCSRISVQGTTSLSLVFLIFPLFSYIKYLAVQPAFTFSLNIAISLFFLFLPIWSLKWGSCMTSASSSLHYPTRDDLLAYVNWSPEPGKPYQQSLVLTWLILILTALVFSTRGPQKYYPFQPNILFHNCCPSVSKSTVGFSCLSIFFKQGS